MLQVKILTQQGRQTQETQQTLLKLERGPL